MRANGPLHRVAASASLYDAVQLLAGVRVVHRHVVRCLASLPSRQTPTVLDVGSGTGLARAWWPADATYIGIDTDPAKLERLRRRVPTGAAVRADGTSLPIRDGTADFALCIAVGHHMRDAGLGLTLGECARALKPDGHLVLLEPLASSRWLPNRALWWVDRGSHPRTAEQLLALVRSEFDIVAEERFSVLHDYLLLVGVPLAHRAR